MAQEYMEKMFSSGKSGVNVLDQKHEAAHHNPPYLTMRQLHGLVEEFRNKIEELKKQGHPNYKKHELRVWVWLACLESKGLSAHWVKHYLVDPLSWTFIDYPATVSFDEQPHPLDAYITIKISLASEQNKPLRKKIEVGLPFYLPHAE